MAPINSFARFAAAVRWSRSRRDFSRVLPGRSAVLLACTGSVSGVFSLMFS